MRLAALMVAIVTGAPVGAATAQSASQAAPTPQEVLSLEIGADSVLADWSQIGRYLSSLAVASPSVRLDTIGASTLGKPLLLVTITSPENQSRLQSIRAGQALLADPRGLTPDREDSLVRVQPAVVFINNNIHSTEIASSQFSMLLAHRLASAPEYQSLLHDLVVLMTPSANPDGLDTVVAWYRQHKGSPFEGGPLPWLYHPYVGHDNNRDWFMLTQVESRAIARVLYREWFPEVVWDVHQMGNAGARMFVPPFSDPVNPNIDPIVVAATNLIGTAMATALYDAGKTGIQHQSRFDLWWHGGFRTVPARHNMIGILSEAASARLASPIEQRADELRPSAAGVNFPEPWPGGRWGLPEIIEYELIAAHGLLRLVGSQREAFVRRFVTLGRRAIAAGMASEPYAFVIPAEQRDPGAVAVLTRALLDAGIEIRRATSAFETDGTRYPSGTLVISMAQPFRAHVKDLLEVQRYPNRRQYPGGPPARPYDVAGWTLPWQMGIAVDPIDQPLHVTTEPVGDVVVAPGTVFGSGTQWVLANRTAAESRTITEALRAGGRVWVTSEPVTVQDTTLAPGAVVLEHGDDAGFARLVREHVESFGFDAWATSRLDPPGRTLDALPRIGVYKPWTASMDEGWTRWVLEQNGIPYVSVTDSLLRAGDLHGSIDVLLLPSLRAQSIEEGIDTSRIPARFAGGLGPEGTGNVAQFVRSGGTLVALDGASEFAIDLLDLPVTDATVNPPDSAAERFYAPGSVFAVELRVGDPLTSGMEQRAFVYFNRSRGFTAAGGVEVLGRYADDVLRSGYALNPERLEGAAALVYAKVDQGRVVLFGFRPQHRGQTHGTYKLLFNALLLSELQ
jgi:hypothetical protein